MRAFLIALVVMLLTLSSLAVLGANKPSDAPPPYYRVVAHPANPISRVERTFVQDAFLKKVRRWPNQTVILPVDLVAASPVRRRFSEEVVGRSVSAVRAYWQQRIFSGRDVPPPELGDDAKVVAHVLKNVGAVGYVSGACDVRGLKVLVIER